MIESKGHKITPIDGDLAVSRNAEIGGDADIHGKARVAGSLKVEGFLDAPNIKGAVKGLFATEEELKREYPNPRPGWCAIVLADDERGFLYLAKNREWEKQSEEAKPFDFIADSVSVFASKGELGDLENKVNANADDIYHLKYGMEFRLEDEVAELMLYQRPGDSPIQLALLSSADESYAGVMSAEDKRNLNNSTVKVIAWNNDNDLSNMNDFVVAGVYDIKGEHTRVDDNLPILNTGGGHTFNARLTVLDSSISGSGKDDDKCITQVLSFSNRLGQGEVYIRTGKGASLDNLTWEKWSTLQRNVNVGSVESLDDLIDNGIYSGVLNTTGETFVLVVINNYALAGLHGIERSISQFKYSVNPTGVVSLGKRVKKGDGAFPESWEILNEEKIHSAIDDALRYAINYTDKAIAKVVGTAPDTLNTLQEIAEWVNTHEDLYQFLEATVGLNTVAIEDEKTRAENAEKDIKRKAVDVETLNASVLQDEVNVYFRNLNGVQNGFTIPAATTESAGVMSAEDKVALDKVVEDVKTKQTIKEISWNSTQHLDSYITAGVYIIDGKHLASDGFPINNTGVISARLTVLITYSDDKSNLIITQVLNLNNNGGGEGNMYIRSCQNGEWKAWGKLQTNVEVGLIDQTKMDDLTDNGIYSGILSTTGETFVIICINNYAIAQQVGVQHISHLKYSLVVGTGEVRIEKRTRDAYGFWTEWENIGGSSTLSEATVDTIGGVRLGTVTDNTFAPLVNITQNGTGVGIQLDSTHFINGSFGLTLKHNSTIKYNNGLGVALGIGNNNHSIGSIIPCVLGTGEASDSSVWNSPSVGILYNKDQFCLKSNGLNLKDGIGSGVTKVTWDSSSNMNDYRTAGVYEIYGERTRQDDNLPILNASPGHSIAARLTVVASTLQPANTEICVTQFLQLSNRIGGEGTTYVRTYNENNNDMNGWSPWQKQMGMVETYVNSDTISVDFQGNYRIGSDSYAGLNNFIDNGMYSGVYTSSSYFSEGTPEFLETFVLIVINDYAITGQVGLPRHITQLKYAVDAITGQSTVKKRVGTGNDTISWSDWTDIGGGGSVTIEVSYSTLLNLRDTDSLIPGMKYRITDYITTTAQENTVSAGNPFDIIVTADTINSLNENAAACQNKDDGYFDDTNFSAWELKYSLDNDTSRFAWADAENGKGVIYYMKDEHNNECAYDFKNIMFVRYKLNAPTVGGYSYEWQNRMSENINKMFEGNLLSYLWHGVSDEDDYYWEDEWGEVISSPTGETKAFFTFSNVVNDIVTDKSKTSVCHSNIIKESRDGVQLVLNNIVFFSTDITYYCYSNSFGNYCNSNSFGNYCNYNSFGNYCNYNSFGNYCNSNSFGNYCNYNSFGNYCNSNSFGNDCNSNSFGNDCYSNSFGNDCYSNSFGNYCYYNSFGNSCNSNSFGNSCNSNSFGNSCNYNGFFDDSSYVFNDNTYEYLCDGNPLDYVQNNKFGDGCSHLLIYNVGKVGPDESIQNLNIAQGFSSISIDTANGLFYPEVIEIDTVGQDYEIKIARNSKGEVRIYCEADLIV